MRKRRGRGEEDGRENLKDKGAKELFFVQGVSLFLCLFSDLIDQLSLKEKNIRILQGN